MLVHRSEFESSFEGRTVAAVETGPIDPVDALDSALDPDLDHYCTRMRLEVAQGDELTMRAAALILQTDIQVLKFNSTTTTNHGAHLPRGSPHGQ